MDDSTLQTAVRDPASSICFIDRIPVEILGLIFEFIWFHTAPHPRLDIESWPWYHPIDPSLIWITHVCRGWRDVALDMPLLWSRVDDTNGFRMLTFLHRSRTAPVSFSACLSISHRGIGNGLIDSVIASCAERLRRLDLRLEAHDIFTYARIDFRAPSLEVLTIQCEIYDGVQVADHPILLQGETSSLKALALLHVRHWLPGNYFPNLAHLNISYFFMEELPLVMLCHLLSNCPRLETLHLGQVWSYILFDLDLALPPRSIPLPNLRSLSTCYATLQTVQSLLYSLELPRRVHIRVHDALLQAHTDMGENYLPYLDFMGPLTRLELAADATTLYMMAEGDDGAIWVQAKWERGEPSVWRTWLDFLHNMLELPNIQTFHVSLWDWDILPPLLKYMSSLTTLGVMSLPNDEDPKQMVDALCPDLKHDNFIICPNLSTLSIQCHSNPSVDALSSMVTQRAARGYRLSHLIVDRVRLPSAVSDELRLDVDSLLPLMPHIHTITIGQGGLCTWEKKAGWDVENEHWRLPEGDEPRCVFPWHPEE